MTDTLSAPTNRDEADQVEYGQNVIFRLLGSTVTAFGATDKGEIFLQVTKDGVRSEFTIGKDSAGEIELF